MPSAKQQPSNIKHDVGIRPNVCKLTFNNNNNSILLHNLKNYGPLLWAEYVSLLKCPDLKII